MAHSVRNILIFQSCYPLGLDLVATAASSRELRRAFPEARIGIATNNKGVELYRHNIFGIESFDVSFDQKNLPGLEFFESMAKINEGQYDTALVFPLAEPDYLNVMRYGGRFSTRIGVDGGNSLIQRHYPRLFPEKGFETPFMDAFGFTGFSRMSGTQGSGKGYLGDLFLTYLEPLGVDVTGLDSRPEVWASSRDVESIGEYFGGLGITGADFVFGLNVGGRQGNNSWDTKNYIDFVNRLFDRTGGKVSGSALKLVINYARHEIGVFEDIMGSVSASLPVYGVPKHMTIGQLSEVVGRCDFIFTTDTGTAHVAAAKDTPAVVLYPNEDNRTRWMYPRPKVLPLVGKEHVNDIDVQRALLSTYLAMYEWGKS